MKKLAKVTLIDGSSSTISTTFLLLELVVIRHGRHIHARTSNFEGMFYLLIVQPEALHYASNII